MSSHSLATAACVLAFAITGCGGSAGDMAVKVNTNMGTAGSQSSDAFIDRVKPIISATTEHDGPHAIDSITVTRPEDTEPIPIS
ncbi:MAG TPA: hypothetical protein VGU61_07110 [Noviherbaspirillum sp.]|uniref:hypothetical protein n=1 Tax=Noviherbaspirillum sp. TaxID=1926288 RepID=UPI002DDD85AB|nr:hypothetical protein [Noviherbaspirillum sp.]HEV2610020.1 hypothetical protein [Noviherbaspirillum sp.]